MESRIREKNQLKYVSYTKRKSFNILYCEKI